MTTQRQSLQRSWLQSPWVFALVSLVLLAGALAAWLILGS